ncbi:hypothetical protein Tco_1346603 [Tanacetum coccineum]
MDPVTLCTTFPSHSRSLNRLLFHFSRRLHALVSTFSLWNIRVILFTVKMEILLEPTSNKLMVEHAEFDDSNANVLARFYTSAGNIVKEILLKLNLPDHRILKDGHRDTTLKLFKSTNQERYVGLEVTSSQDGKVYKMAKRDYAWLMISRTQFKELFNSKEFLEELDRLIDERLFKYRELQIKEREVQAIKEIDKRLKEREIQQQESLVTKGTTLEANLSTDGTSLDATSVIKGNTLEACLVTDGATLEACLITEGATLEASLVTKSVALDDQLVAQQCTVDSTTLLEQDNECNSSKNDCSRSGNENRSPDNESSSSRNDADADIGPTYDSDTMSQLNHDM